MGLELNSLMMQPAIPKTTTAKASKTSKKDIVIDFSAKPSQPDNMVKTETSAPAASVEVITSALSPDIDVNTAPWEITSLDPNLNCKSPNDFVKENNLILDEIEDGLFEFDSSGGLQTLCKNPETGQVYSDINRNGKLIGRVYYYENSDGTIMYNKGEKVLYDYPSEDTIVTTVLKPGTLPVKIYYNKTTGKNFRQDVIEENKITEIYYDELGNQIKQNVVEKSGTDPVKIKETNIDFIEPEKSSYVEHILDLTTGKPRSSIYYDNKGRKLSESQVLYDSYGRIYIESITNFDKRGRVDSTEYTKQNTFGRLCWVKSITNYDSKGQVTDTSRFIVDEHGNYLGDAF